MAVISRDDVLKLAQLARLSLSDDEVEQFLIELREILLYVEQLKSVNVDNLAPTDQVTGLVNVMRDDITIDYGYAPGDLLGNVPRVEENLIMVQRVL